MNRKVTFSAASKLWCIVREKGCNYLSHGDRNGPEPDSHCSQRLQVSDYPASLRRRSIAPFDWGPLACSCILHEWILPYTRYRHILSGLGIFRQSNLIHWSMVWGRWLQVTSTTDGTYLRTLWCERSNVSRIITDCNVHFFRTYTCPFWGPCHRTLTRQTSGSNCWNTSTTWRCYLSTVPTRMDARCSAVSKQLLRA